MQQQWWQHEAARFLDECVRYVNDSRIHSDALLQCESIIDALNLAWGAYHLHLDRESKQSGSDIENLKELLLAGLAAEGAALWCQSSAVKELATFSPQVERQSVFDAYMRYSGDPSNEQLLTALINELAEFLYILWAVDADSQKYQNDRTMCSLMYPALEEIFNVLWQTPDTRLAAYGSLRPGESNYSMVADITGDWVPGTIIGHISEYEGYPVFTWDPAASKVPVQILVATNLHEHWQRLDEFEGDDYERIWIPVETKDGLSVCNVYAGAL